MPLVVRLALGFFLSGAIGLLAYMRSSLTESGALGAIIVGTLIFGFGGLSWGLLLIAFFVTSTLLSRFRKRQKEQIAAEKFDKGSQRDIWQALANAGAAAAIAVFYHLNPEPTVMAAFIGALATANADTWATELGVLSKTPPRLITTFKPVEPGTSGGVSVTGTLATAAGALVIGLSMVLFFATEQALGSRGAWLPIVLALSGWMLPVAVISGVAGSLFDSLLGATVQVIYYTPYRDKETEKRIDPNGKPNEYLRGWRWLNNDAVNFSATVVGALVGAGVWTLYEQFIIPLVAY